MTPALFHLLLISIVISMAMLMGTTMIALALLLKQKKVIVSMHMHNNKRSNSQQQQPPTIATSQQTYSMMGSRRNNTARIRDPYAPSGTSASTAAEAHLKQAIQYTTTLPPFRNSKELPLLPYDMESEYIQFQRWYKRHSTTRKKTLQKKSSSDNKETRSAAASLIRSIEGRFNTLLSGLEQLTSLTTTLITTSTITSPIDNNKKKKNRISSTSQKRAWRKSVSATSAASSSSFASKNDTDALFHLQRAADLGNPYAQYWMGNILASGIFSSIPSSSSSSSQLKITDDIGNGKSQLARALVQWHFASIQGIQEAQMALGYRYISAFQATGGIGSSSSSKRARDGGFGVVGDCAIALAYYEEAANTAMDEMESSELRGKVPPALDRHRLAEMHMHGASSALAHHNKPDEHEEALEYLRIRATSAGDSISAFSLGQLHHYGLRGVEQNLAQALKYYEMAANAALTANNNNPLSVDYISNPLLTNHPEAAGWAAKFYLLGIGTVDGQPNYEKAWKYMQMGAPGGLKTCSQQEDRHVCDAEALNCFGLAYVGGLPGILEPDPARAARYFTLAKEYGSADGQYNLAMMRLGWMNMEEEVPDLASKNVQLDTLVRNVEPVPSNARPTATKPSKADFSLSFNDLIRAANKGHVQALHKVGLMYAHGIGVQQHCPSAVKFLRQVSEQSPAIGQRIRKAHKSYREGTIDLALWNYLVAAEAGVELAQSNAAWLMERGHCLGLDQLSCAYASVRMWKAASKQGNSDANIRVGDFHYYGRLHPKDSKGGYPNAVDFDWPFLVTYMIQPSHLVQFLKSKMFLGMRVILRKMKDIKLGMKKRTNSLKPPLKESSLEPFAAESDQRHSCADGDDTTCTEISPKEKRKELEQTEAKNRETNFKLAAQCYRKAADAQSGRANFNLGFMYQWGLGLDQDFPLAKRHYDLAATHHPQAELVVSIALWFMHLHERFIAMRKQWTPKIKRFRKQALSLVEIIRLPSDHDSVSDLELRKREILMSHIFSFDMAVVVLLTLLMILLIHRYLKTIQ